MTNKKSDISLLELIEFGCSAIEERSQSKEKDEERSQIKEKEFILSQ